MFSTPKVDGGLALDVGNSTSDLKGVLWTTYDTNEIRQYRARSRRTKITKLARLLPAPFKRDSTGGMVFAQGPNAANKLITSSYAGGPRGRLNAEPRLQSGPLAISGPYLRDALASSCVPHLGPALRRAPGLCSPRAGSVVRARRGPMHSAYSGHQQQPPRKPLAAYHPGMRTVRVPSPAPLTCAPRPAPCLHDQPKGHINLLSYTVDGNGFYTFSHVRGYNTSANGTLFYASGMLVRAGATRRHPGLCAGRCSPSPRHACLRAAAALQGQQCAR